MVYFLFRIPQPIDSEVLKNMKMVNFVGHAPRPANKRFPNVVPYELKPEISDIAARSKSPQVGKGATTRQGSDPLSGLVGKKFFSMDRFYH